MQLAYFGTFPNFRWARVVWTGVELDAIDFTARQDGGAISRVERPLAPNGATYRRLHAATLGGR